MIKLTRCGYCCELCKAYAPNIEKSDQREKLSELWKIYYDLDIPATDIYCEGCLSEKPDARLIDNNCPVRKCVTDRQINHCGDCLQYPCDTFLQRKGLSREEMIEKNPDFEDAHYCEFLNAYDNKTYLQTVNTP